MQGLSPERRMSRVLSDDHRLLVFDYGHWTLDGARLYGELMLDQGFLRLLQRGAG